MIDTVHINLHNLSKYSFLNTFLSEKYFKKNTVSRAYMNTETGEKLKDQQYLAGVFFHDKNNFLPLTTWSTENLGSFHYSVAYKLDIEKDVCKFNFSIPKFLYGTNILQFVPFSYSVNASNVYNDFLVFVKNFFQEYLFTQIDFYDVEIERIDLCYNQIFSDKKSALMYLDEQKKINHKYARSSGNTGMIYDSSLFYKTKLYSFKIYHKGTEFEKHDYKELQKNNPRKYDLGYFLEESNKILRYEVTFRKSFFREIFQKYFIPYDGKKYSKNHKYFNDTHYIFFTKLHKILPVKDINKFIKAFGTTYVDFRLNSLFDDLKNDMVDTLNSKSLKFSENLFSELYRFFWKKFDQYKINTIESPSVIYDKIIENNEKADRRKKIGMKEKKMDIGRMLPVLLLSQYVSIESLKKYYNERTFERLRADIRSLGYSTTTNQSTTHILPPYSGYDHYKIIFGMYHNVINIY